MKPHHVIDGPGQAPVLVLGPSLGTTLALFDPQVAALAGEYRIVRFDLRGHGSSPAPEGPYTIAGLAGDVLELADSLGIERFHYAGVSIGGAIGQRLAIEAGERLASLAVIASAARFADPESWPQRAATVRAEGTEVLVGSRTGTWFTPEFAEREPEATQRLLDMLRTTTREGYAGCCEAIGGFDARAALGRIGVPSLAVAGACDPATTPEMVAEIAEGIPGAKFLSVPDGAHLVGATHPEPVTEALAAHLKRAADGSRA
jgi:3-oxoadipate enol-lactonase